MQNVQIQVHNDVINLVDKNGAILFFSEDWYEVEEFADENDFNIQYEPKDLVFDVDPNSEDGPYVFFDIKYGDGGHDNLGGHNVINLPSFIDSSELMECTFGYKESMTKQQVIDGLVAVGATHEEFLN